MSTSKRPRDWWAVGAGIRAVLVLAVTALDSLVSALAGIPPVRWCARQLAAVVRDAYRVGRFGPASQSTEIAPLVVDGEIVDEETDR